MGSILGERSIDIIKIYFIIKINGYIGLGIVCIFLVIKDFFYWFYFYEFVGKDCWDGFYEVEFCLDCCIYSF